MCNTINQVELSSCLDVELSCLFTLTRALTYCFNAFLELETTDSMATDPVTRAQSANIAIEEWNFQKESWRLKLQPYFCCFATDTVTAAN